MAQRKVKAEVIINQPLEMVFNFISNMDNHADWQTGVLESRITSQGKVGVGSTYRYVTHMMGRRIQTEGEVIKCDPSEGFFYRSTSGPFQIVGGYTFEKTNGNTKVTQSIVANIEGFFRVAEPIVVRSVQRNLKGNLQTLKELLEGGE